MGHYAMKNWGRNSRFPAKESLRPAEGLPRQNAFSPISRYGRLPSSPRMLSPMEMSRGYGNSVGKFLGNKRYTIAIFGFWCSFAIPSSPLSFSLFHPVLSSLWAAIGLNLVVFREVLIDNFRAFGCRLRGQILAKSKT